MTALFLLSPPSDPACPFDSSLDQDTPSLPSDVGQGMTHTYPFPEDEVGLWSAHPLAPPARGDVARTSPRGHSLRPPTASQGSASLSPAGPIYTPSSTIWECDEDNTAQHSRVQYASISPESNTFSADDFVHINGQDDEISSSMLSQPPPSSGFTSSMLALPYSQQQSLPIANQTSQHLQWQRMANPPSNTSMEDIFVPYTSSADHGFPAASWAQGDILSQTLAFNTSLATYNHAASFEMLNHGSLQQLPSTSTGLGLNPQQAVAAMHEQLNMSDLFLNVGCGLTPYPTDVQTSQQQVAGSFDQRDFANQDIYQAPVSSNASVWLQRQQQMLCSQNEEALSSRSSQVRVPEASVIVASAPADQLIQNQGEHELLDYTYSIRPSSPGSQYRRQAEPSPYMPSTSAMQAVRPPSKRNPGHSSHGSIRPFATDHTKRGGRQKNTHLSDKSRQRSHEMRKRGACWRCAMQRDQCDHGEPCQRCINRASKGQLQYFGCDRSKLPDFIHDFLPPQASLTAPHQKQMIEDSVKSEVLRWDQEHQLDLYLTVHYGEPLVWRCYEFVPRTPEFTTQFQFFRDSATGQQVRQIKYSPPFGLLKIEPSDDRYLDAYLERLMQPKYLWEFAWCFYEEESQADPNYFQAHLLDNMCTLFMNTTDPILHALLKDIIRMMLITYIMGHTLCIVESNLPTVMSSIRHTKAPAECPVFTSPKMANRQLKFFFGLLRTQIYEKILKWQQQTFHTGGRKESTWIHSFCVMLGFAMVLEEIQRLMHIQAEIYADRGIMSWNDASRQAENAFDRIDERYKLLIGLFQCKYRDKSWTGNGSFGLHTPQLKEPAQVDFLHDVRYLLVRDQNHLRSRENVPFGKETQCLYTTRQTARFLLPFLTLQGC